MIILDNSGSHFTMKFRGAGATRAWDRHGRGIGECNRAVRRTSRSYLTLPPALHDFTAQLGGYSQVFTA